GGSPSADGGVTRPTELTGNATYDFTAHKSVETDALASGQMTVTFDIVRAPVRSKKEVLTFTDFLLAPSDPHGPRNGSYVYYARPTVGGSLKFQNSLE